MQTCMNIHVQNMFTWCFLGPQVICTVSKTAKCLPQSLLFRICLAVLALFSEQLPCINFWLCFKTVFKSADFTLLFISRATSSTWYWSWRAGSEASLTPLRWVLFSLTLKISFQFSCFRYQQGTAIVETSSSGNMWGNELGELIHGPTVCVWTFALITSWAGKLPWLFVASTVCRLKSCGNIFFVCCQWKGH